MSKIILIFIGIIFSLQVFVVSGIGQTAPTKRVVSPFKTHFAIDRFRPKGKAKHLVFINPTVTQKNLLLIHFPGTGGVAENAEFWLGNAANQGFHVIGLAYINDITIGSICGDSSDPNCFENARLEVIDGVDSTPDLLVRKFDSIEFRIIKLLENMQFFYPNENWGQFLDARGRPIWSKIVLSGHSQGGGHAALMAKTRNVARVIQFASTADFSSFFNAPATWLSKPSITPNGRYFGFGHQRDQIVLQNRLLQNWTALGMNAFGSPILVDSIAPPYQNSHQLYTNLPPRNGSNFHGAMISDELVPLGANNQPVFIPVWNYLLNLPAQP